MTRINTGIRAFELTDQLLMAEYREILRVPNMAFKWLKRHPICDHSSLPKVFSLNTGHVRFFYNKLAYIESRYADLHTELLFRKYKIQFYDIFEKFTNDDDLLELYNDYNETPNDRLIVSLRIKDRLETTKGRVTMHKEPITAQAWYDDISASESHLRQVSNNLIQRAAV